MIATLLLLALPASGKSELRRYLASLPPEVAAGEFGLGSSVQLDDYPYVHLMRRISEEAIGHGEPPPFFASTETPFLHPEEWGTLIHLLNEDYAMLGTGITTPPPDAASWLIDRFDRARHGVGLPPVLAAVSPSGRQAIAAAIEEEAGDLLRERSRPIAGSKADATVVIEFARGGPEGAALPLEAPYGYRHSLGALSAEILATASILYVWVTPDESRRRNRERARPGRDGDASILHHGVPEVVMRNDYGVDDMMWLVDNSDEPGTVRVEAAGGTFHLPVAVFDNRVDKTSFLRGDPEEWPVEAVQSLHAELVQAFTRSPT